LVVWLVLDASDYITTERLNASGSLDKDGAAASGWCARLMRRRAVASLVPVNLSAALTGAWVPDRHCGREGPTEYGKHIGFRLVTFAPRIAPSYKSN
jgi:hypothetical protein